MGCMPFLYGQRRDRALYRGMKQSLNAYSGVSSLECTLWEHSRCSTDRKYRMYSGCQAHLQQAQPQIFVQASMQAAA